MQARDRRIKELEKAARAGGGASNGSVDLDALAARATGQEGARVLTEVVSVVDDKVLLDVMDRLKGRLGDAAIVLGAATGGRVHLVASVAPSLVDRGVRAGAVVKIAAEVAGGGGGGRDTMARAGGRDPEKLPEAIAAAAPPSTPRWCPSPEASRCASWPWTTAARGAAAPSATRPGRSPRPIDPVLAPGTRKGMGRLEALVREREVGRVVVGLPLALRGDDSDQTRETRAFAARLRRRLRDIPVELYDERLTTRVAQRLGGAGSEDSRAAAVLLDDWLARHGGEQTG